MFQQTQNTHSESGLPETGHNEAETFTGPYPALVQRGLIAGLSAKQIANALQETTGMAAKTLLAKLNSLPKR
ncbi:MAG: hypothetical protein Kow006_24550 [Gammaproteobacteria bacterium]